MTDGDRDPGPLSRRAILTGLAAVGAAGVGGAGTSGLFGDEEHARGAVTSGTVDFEASWDAGGDTVSFGTVEAVGDGGSEDLRLSVPPSSNPVYVWMRTGCRQCTDLEDRLHVTVGLETADGTEQVFAGTLGEMRDALGTGVRLDGQFSPGEEWVLTVSWELRETLPTDSEVEFSFEFYAIQARNVDDPAAHAPAWDCSDGCWGTSTHGISWVGLHAESGATIAADDVDLTVDGSTLELNSAPPAVAAVLLKYGPTLDVFADPEIPGTFVAGEGDTYDQQGNEFPGSGRSNSDPFPGACGLKYEVDTDEWETTGCEND